MDGMAARAPGAFPGPLDQRHCPQTDAGPDPGGLPPIVQYGGSLEAGSFHGARTLWTDGSGRSPRDARKRVCSWAVVAGPGNWARGALPGPQQTVFRAGLYAIVVALEGTQGPVRVASDCQWGGQQGEEAARGG